MKLAIIKKDYDRFSIGIIYLGGYCIDLAFGWVGFSLFFNVYVPSALSELSEIPPIECLDCGSKRCESVIKNEGVK